MKMLKQILLKIGLDGTIFFTILTRAIQAGGVILSVIVMPKFLTANEQGYFYTFASIIAIQVFFELGLTVIITQYTAHEFAHLKLVDNKLEGDHYYRSRVSSLLHFCVKWFGAASIGLFFILIGVGFYFFNTYNNNTQVEWQYPWVILCISTALNLFIDPILAYFDGLSRVKDMAKVRLLQKTAQTVLLFLMLILHAKLYALAISSLAAILVNYLQIVFSNRYIVLKNIWAEKTEWIIHYMQEIFPFQWRIALSWVSGYFIFQLFNPILFATDGPVVAGQMGMTLQVLNGVTALSMSWITTKIPALSGFIAKKEYAQLDVFFKNALIPLAIIAASLLVIFNTGIFLLNYYDFSYAHRFLPLWATVILSLCCLAMQITGSWAIYIRCHKKEPFLLQAVVMGILCCISISVLGKLYGLKGIVCGYGFLTIFVSFIWSYFLFTNKKKEWHQPELI